MLGQVIAEQARRVRLLQEPQPILVELPERPLLPAIDPVEHSELYVRHYPLRALWFGILASAGAGVWISSRGGLDARAWRPAEADLVVGDPERDQRCADDGRPEPAHGDREEREIDDREGRHRRDVRSEHARHVSEPPRVPVRRRTYELPDVEPREDHPADSEDDRDDAEPLPARARPNEPEHRQRGAHGKGHESGRPVDRDWAVPLTGALARERPIARERLVEAED